VKDEFNTVVNQRLPGLLAELCGVEVEEYDSLSSHMQNEIEFALPGRDDHPCVTVGTLCEILKPTTATVIGRYREDYYAEKPAVTLNQFGTGRVVYVGAVGDSQLYDVLAKWLLETVDGQQAFVLPPGVEVAERKQGDRNLHFVLNHSNSPQALHLENHFTDLLTNQQLHGAVQLNPFDVLILEALK
jgi:beta-galactosidase